MGIARPPYRFRVDAARRRRPPAGRAAALLIVTAALVPAPPAGAEQTTTPATAPAADPVAALSAEVDALRRDYESRLAALESALAELRAELERARAEARAAAEAAPPPREMPTAAPPAPPAPQPPPSTEQDEQLAALLAAARAAAGAAEAAPAARAEAPAVTGRLSLNRFNPEISFTGDLLAVASSDDRDEFRNREFELDFQSALDPFSRTRWTIAFADGEAEVEEGYIVYPTLPGGLGLTAGRFRQQFGALNRQHAHALPQSDYPLALRTYFGDEGLAQTGLSARWLLPHSWADANELTLELTDGENDAFGGEDFEDFAGLAHLKSFWDLSDAAWVELGLSAAAGRTPERTDHRIYGADWTVHWQPPQRAKYRELTWRTELLLSDLELPGGESEQAWGGYSYLEGLIAQNLYAGARVDRVEDPLDPGHRTWGVVPYLTWWQSEFVRLRAEYRRFEDEASGDSAERFLLQLTWAAGPHKHETY